MLMHGVKLDPNLTLIVISNLHEPKSPELVAANRPRAQTMLDLEELESFCGIVEEMLQLIKLAKAGQPSSRLEELQKKLGIVSVTPALEIRTIYCSADPLLDDVD